MPTGSPAIPARPHGTRGRLAGIEAGRGVAATIVVLYHAARHVDQAYGAPGLKAVFQFGHAGVDFFFVISGFIILFVHRADIGRPARAPLYLSRRATRLLPTYWVALAITIAMTTASRGTLPGAWDLIRSVLLLPTLHEPLLGVAWTLQHEVIFYALFLVLIINRAAGHACFALWAMTIGIAALAADPEFAERSPVCSFYNFEFFLGMGAALVLTRNRVAGAPALLAAGVLLFAAAAITEDLGLFGASSIFARLWYGAPSALIVVAAGAVSPSSASGVPRWLATLGSASYSLYLFQFICIGLVWKALDATGAGLPASACFVLLAAAAIAGGVMFSQTLETPLIALARRTLERRMASG